MPETTKIFDSVLDLVGNTPLIRLHSSVIGIPAKVYAKVEAFNPGQSAKDRIAKYIVEQAERTGKIKPGGTFIESTSGNTGFSLAMVCRVKGYNCVLTISDKSSKEKIDLLRAMGAEVHVCPAKVAPDSPESYYSVAKRLERIIPNSYYINQYYNAWNGDAHYASTGPEIWDQTSGTVTHYVCGVGTGGTISGPARFLKQQNRSVQIIGVDAYGSALKKYHETEVFDESEVYPYTIEGVGKNIIPSSVEFRSIDQFVKVTDKDSAQRARNLALQEGLLVGHSSGAALQGVFEIADQLTAEHVVVVLFPDHGSRYLSKIFSDEWMQQNDLL